MGDKKINAYFIVKLQDCKEPKWCGGSCADATEKARGRGELTFCGEDGKESDIFDV